MESMIVVQERFKGKNFPYWVVRSVSEAIALHERKPEIASAAIRYEKIISVYAPVWLSVCHPDIYETTV